MVIEEFLGIRRCSGNVELKVKRKGFDASDTSWVSVDTLREDVPVMLEEYQMVFKSNDTTNEKKHATYL